MATVKTLSLEGEKRLRDLFADQVHREIVCASEKMRELLNVLPKIARADSNVLITGETGVGKELVARAIHRLSDRAGKEFVAVNCAAFPEGLLESELFGHVRGAFTGAHCDRPGLFEVASGGTLFLDEIGDMPLNLQAKLLRVIESGRFRRVGGVTEMNVNVRIIAATNKDLKKEIEEGRFREDLYYRLNVIPVHIPPLRERREDISLLAEHFAKKFAPSKRLTQEALEALKSYSWKGNVRELKNVIERVCLLSQSDEITVRDLPSEITGMVEEEIRLPELTPEGINLDELTEKIERACVAKALRLADHAQARAAELLGLSPRSLRYRLAKHKVKV